MAAIPTQDAQEASAIWGLHWAWIILPVCFINLFFNYSIRLGFGVLLPEMIRSLDLNRVQGGSIYNAYISVYICLTPLTGNLTDRFGARRVITLFGILLGIGTLFLGTTDRLGTACLAFGLAGAGGSAMWTPLITVVQRWFASSRRGMALGIVSTGYGLGFAAMGWLFPVLVEAYSWRFCWFVLGTSVLIMVVINGVFLRSSPESLHVAPWGEKDRALQKQNTDPVVRDDRYGEVFRMTRFWTIGASFFFVSVSLYMVTTFMVDYANVQLGFTFKEASFLATIHGLGQVVGVLTIPIVSDRIGRRSTLIGSNLFIALSILGIIFAGRDLLGLYVTIAVLAIFYGVTWPMYGACAGDYFPKEVMGTVIGAWTPFYGLDAISAHFIAGRIRDITQSFEPAFYLAMISALVASYLMLKVRVPARAD